MKKQKLVLKQTAEMAAVQELTQADVQDYRRLLQLAFRGHRALTICLQTEKYRQLILATPPSRKAFIDAANASSDIEIKETLSKSTIFEKFPDLQEHLFNLMENQLENASHTNFSCGK